MWSQENQVKLDTLKASVERESANLEAVRWLTIKLEAAHRELVEVFTEVTQLRKRVATLEKEVDTYGVGAKHVE